MTDDTQNAIHDALMASLPKMETALANALGETAIKELLGRDFLTLGDVLDLIRKESLEFGGRQYKLAEKLGVSTQEVSHVLRGRRGPMPKMLDSLGLEARTVTVYIPKRQNPNGHN